MVLKRAADLVYTFRFLKLLTTKFEDTTAYDLGLIDAKGKRNKAARIDTTQKKNSYTSFHRLVFNLKKIINKSGSEKYASYASALFLIKEKYDVNVDKILKASEIDTSNFISENSKWFILEDGTLAPGKYRLRSDQLLSETCGDLVVINDYVKIGENSLVGEILGIDIYEAIHQKTQQKVFVTIGELYK